jgi:arylsulfatase A-like enzyme
VYERLRLNGLENDTILVVTSDHGRIHDIHHLHVPAMIVNPEIFRQETRITSLTSHLDLPPTILDLLGVNEVNHFQGESVFTENPGKIVYLDGHDTTLGIVDENWLFYREYKYLSDRVHLYNVSSDRKNRVDSSKQYPEVVEEYCRMMDQYRMLQSDLLLKNKLWPGYEKAVEMLENTTINKAGFINNT